MQARYRLVGFRRKTLCGDTQGECYEEQADEVPEP